MDSNKKNKKKKNKAIEVKIETINERADKISPLIGYFPSGFEPHESSSSIKVYRNEKRSKRFELVVSPNGSDQLDFVATNYLGEAAAGRMCNFALGILDKGTHILKIVPIAANKVFRLEPRLRTKEKPDEEVGTPAKTEVTVAERIERINDLTNKYGTKTAIKRARKTTLLRQTEDTSTQQDTDLFQETAIDEQALTSTEADVHRNVPPHNAFAETPEKAYLLDKIIPKGEWDYLEDILELLHDGKDLNLGNYPSFVCNRVYKLEVIKDEAEKRRVAGILSYITHLVNFKDQNSLDGYSSSKHCKIPSMIHQNFSKMFINSDKNRLSDEKIGLLVNYVLVLTLFIDDFQTDFLDIARDLKMSALTIRPYFESIGCRFKAKNKVMTATLPVPLKFPVLRRRRKRG